MGSIRVWATWSPNHLMKLVQIPAIYLEAIRFPFTSDTLVWPYYVSDVNFVSDWIYVLNCLISDLGTRIIFFCCHQCHVGLFSQLYYWCFHFASWLCLYSWFIILLLWPLFISLISDLCVGCFILDVEFKFWGTFFCEYLFWQSDIWWAYQRDSWQSRVCLT